MISFPNCKINLGLRILRKRNDGYHDLETVFYPLPFYDIIEVIQAADGPEFSGSGHRVDGEPANNLCIKAFELLKKDFPDLPAVKLHLHKTIPLGAGLGGGSADGAFTLQLINQKFHLGLSRDQLLNYALQLGSDAPFFIINKPCLATGRGEVMEEIAIDLSSYWVLLANPGIHVNTGVAFSGISPAIPEKSVQVIIQQPVDTWKQELINDFEATVFKTYPLINQIKETLYSEGAVYASMSGSGSTVFGLFEDQSSLAKASSAFKSNDSVIISSSPASLRGHSAWGLSQYNSTPFPSGSSR
jgi:4-diphosphocytidyl-2-C-methyl-D-erythritol kinase